MEKGDMVIYIEDIIYKNAKGKEILIKSGYKLIFDRLMGDKVIATRYGKSLILDIDKVKKV
jgi:hypothetical protein